MNTSAVTTQRAILLAISFAFIIVQLDVTIVPKLVAKVDGR